MRRGRSSLPTPLRLGISACLLGQAVRYDGGHKRDPFLAETLGRFVEWVPVCPEVELGLGVPREPIRLEGDPAAPRPAARLPHRARAPAPRARSRRLPPPGRAGRGRPEAAPPPARRRIRRRLHARAPHPRHAAPAHVLEHTLAYPSGQLAPAEPE